MSEEQAWDLFFSGMVGWSYHPGYFKEGAKRMTLEECAAVADDMLSIRRDRCLG